MKDGLISVACGTPEVRVADCHHNAEQIFLMMRQAEQAGVKVLVLPELVITGASCGDLFYQEILLRGAIDALQTVLTATRNLEVVTAVGMPVQVQNKLYNCAVVIQKGRILGVVPKTHLSNHGDSCEARYFASPPCGQADISLCGQQIPFGAGQLFRCGNLPELVLGFELGQDLWAPQPPSVEMACGGAVIIGNLSAGRDVIGKDVYRRRLVTTQSGRLLCGYLHSGSGQGESTADGVHTAHQLIAENGELLSERRYEGGLLISEIDIQRLSYERRHTQVLDGSKVWEYRVNVFELTLQETQLSRYVAPQPFVPEDKALRDERCREVLLLASLGLKHRLEHTGAKTAVVGLSGGLDSTLAVLITGLAMKMLNRPMTDIVAVTMPCFGTTDRTKNNAVILAEQLGAVLRTVDISGAVRGHFKDIGHPMEDYSVTFENAQARERTQVLMDIANQSGGIVIGTGDLSELALGWCTYNGDHMSMYGVNAGIPKTLIRHLVAHLARDNEETDEALHDVLEDILDTPVSPELLPVVQGETVQRTEDLVGPYELHDFFLYYLLRWGFSPGKIYRLAVYALGKRYDRQVILKWLKVFYRRFFTQQFKRSCLPEGPAVGAVGLSPRGEWQMPSDITWTLWNSELETL